MMSMQTSQSGVIIQLQAILVCLSNTLVKRHGLEDDGSLGILLYRVGVGTLIDEILFNLDVWCSMKSSESTRALNVGYQTSLKASRAAAQRKMFLMDR